MKLELRRYFTDNKHTKGILVLDGKVLCHTIEDPHHEVKVPGETRIPEGTYQLKLRKVGGFHQRYSKKFDDEHYGMVEITDVEGFTYILMHIGNSPADTEGCVLLGSAAETGAYIAKSTKAYQKFYAVVGRELHMGGSVELEVIYV